MHSVQPTVDIRLYVSFTTWYRIIIDQVCVKLGCVVKEGGRLAGQKYFRLLSPERLIILSTKILAIGLPPPQSINSLHILTL
jgi:hypothetical protein